MTPLSTTTGEREVVRDVEQSSPQRNIGWVDFTERRRRRSWTTRRGSVLLAIGTRIVVLPSIS